MPHDNFEFYFLISIVVIPLAGLLGFYLVFVHNSRILNRLLENTASSLGCKTIGRRRAAGVHAGIAYRLKAEIKRLHKGAFLVGVSRYDKRAPYEYLLLVSVGCHAMPAFGIAEENASHAALKTVGLKKDIVTGDAFFDVRFIIDSESHESTSALLSRPNMRQSVTDAFDNGCFSIACKGGFLTAKLSMGVVAKPYVLSTADDVPEPSPAGADSVKSAVSALSIISKEIAAAQAKKKAGPAVKVAG